MHMTEAQLEIREKVARLLDNGVHNWGDIIDIALLAGAITVVEYNVANGHFSGGYVSPSLRWWLPRKPLNEKQQDLAREFVAWAAQYCKEPDAFYGAEVAKLLEVWDAEEKR